MCMTMYIIYDFNMKLITVSDRMLDICMTK